MPLDAAQSVETLPSNIEAEQAVLGALLVNNDVASRLDRLRDEHFYDPVHARIYAEISRRLADGGTASPVTLKAAFSGDAGLSDLGGPSYLLRLFEAAVTVFDVGELAREIIDAHARRSIIAACQNAMETARQGGDPTSIASLLDISVIGLDFGKSKGPMRFAESMSAAAQMANEAYQSEGRSSGLLTGLKDLDALTSGFRRGNLVVVAGRPGMGKTAIASSLALTAAQSENPFIPPSEDTGEVKSCGVILISLEMSHEEIAFRINSDDLCRNGVNLPYKLAMDGFIDRSRRDPAREAGDFERWIKNARKIEELPISIADLPGQSPMPMVLSEIRRRAAMLEQSGAPVGLIIIDYLGHIEKPNTRDNEASRIGYLTSSLKGLAKRMKCCVMLLSQLNRGVESREDKHPTLADLRDSGAIEQDADVVLFPFRPEHYLLKDRPSDAAKMADWEQEMSKWGGLAEVRVAKNRSGPEGVATVHCNIACNHFANLARGSHGV